MKRCVFLAVVVLSCCLLAVCGQAGRKPYGGPAEGSLSPVAVGQKNSSGSADGAVGAPVSPPPSAQSAPVRYLLTDPVPESATQYARTMYSTFTRRELLDMGFSEADVPTMRLCDGVKIGGPEEYADLGYYFFVASDNGVVALLLVIPMEDGDYGSVFGGDPLIKGLNTLVTAEQNPARITATPNGYYSIDAVNGVLLLQEFPGSTPEKIAADRAAFGANIDAMTATGTAVLVG